MNISNGSYVILGDRTYILYILTRKHSCAGSITYLDLPMRDPENDYWGIVSKTGMYKNTTTYWRIQSLTVCILLVVVRILRIIISPTLWTTYTTTLDYSASHLDTAGYVLYFRHSSVYPIYVYSPSGSYM